MGQKHQKVKKIFEVKKDINIPKEEKLSKSSFKFISIIGLGIWKSMESIFQKI